MKFKGKLSRWNDDKGFGFVEPNGGGERSFVHIKSFRQPARRPVNGDVLIYEQARQRDGKFKAVNIRLAGERHKQAHSSPQPAKFGKTVATLFFVVLGAATVLNLLPVQLLYWYGGASIIAFVVYAWDKSAAQHQRWRTPESHLHLLALIGGWPGAGYAQSTLRHKSSKKGFQRVFWGTVAVNLGVLVWLFGAQGQQFIGNALG